MTSTKQEIPYEHIFDTYSSAYDSLSSLSKGYDNLIVYGKQVTRQIKQEEKGLASKTLKLFQNIQQGLKPISQASLSTVKQAGKKLREAGSLTFQTGQALIYAIGDSKEYIGLQDMYKGYSRTETSDRTERINRETEAQTGNLLQRLGKTLGNTLKNAKEYRKMQGFASELGRAGLFATPLQAYALKNGNFEVYSRLIPREKQEPTITVNIGGVNYAFNDAKQFTDIVKGFYNFSAMGEMFNGMNSSRTANSEQTRNEPKNIDPEDITVSEPSYYRRPKALLTTGKSGGSK